MESYKVSERLAKTEDDRVVPESDPDARWLYAIPGHEIPLEEAERYGLIKAGEPAEDKAAEKAEEPALSSETKASGLSITRAKRRS